MMQSGESTPEKKRVVIKTCKPLLVKQQIADCGIKSDAIKIEDISNE